MQALGWTLFGEPASPDLASATRGGLAMAVKKCRGAWRKHHFQQDGAGFQSIAIQSAGVEIQVAVVLPAAFRMRSPWITTCQLRQCPGLEFWKGFQFD